MRKIRFSAAMSLDGYIAAPDGSYDWIVMDHDINFQTMFARYDTVLIGRKSYEASLAMGQAGTMPGMKAFVVSNTLKPQEHPNLNIVGAKLPEFVRNLKNQPGKDIWLFGGGDLLRSMLALELVDTIEVAIIPVLLGGGIPLLPAPASMSSLELIQHQHFPKSGILLLEYSTKNRAEK